MQKAVLKVDLLNIRQGMDEKYSHDGEFAIDISRHKKLYTPFDCIVKRLYVPCNGIFIQSINKVKFGDGKEDYMCMMVLHAKSIKHLKVGQKLRQFEFLCSPGNKGISTGKHNHIGVGLGKFTGNGWSRGKYQEKVKAYSWPINNQYNLVNALFLDKDVKIKNDYNYKWIINNDKNIYYPKCKSNIYSLVDGLKSINVDSSFKNRTLIAHKNGILLYLGTAKSNVILLNKLKSGKLKQV